MYVLFQRVAIFYLLPEVARGAYLCVSFAVIYFSECMYHENEYNETPFRAHSIKYTHLGPHFGFRLNVGRSGYIYLLYLSVIRRL